jgi:hypothetical protein
MNRVFNKEHERMFFLDQSIRGEIEFWGKVNVRGARRQWKGRGELVCVDVEGIVVYPVSWALWDSVDF